MSTVRENLVYGTVQENPLTAGATTLTMAGRMQNLPTVSPPNIARLTIDPHSDDILAGSGAEIVYVTAYTHGAPSSVILRGQEDTVARPHSQGVDIVNVATRADWGEVGYLALANHWLGPQVVDGNVDIGGQLAVTGPATFTSVHATGGAQVDGVLNAGGLAVFQGGIVLQGSINGYIGGELNVPTGAAALTTNAAGTPQIFMDHRALGNTGEWWWRNNTGASATQMRLTAVGHLQVTGNLYTHADGLGGSVYTDALYLTRAGGGIRDQTSGHRMLYGDAGNVYMGAIDGPRWAVMRGAGVDGIVLTGTVMAVQPAVTAYFEAPNTYMGVGGAGAAGAALNVYADTGAADVWLRAMDFTGTFTRTMNFRAGTYGWYDGSGNAMMGMNPQSALIPSRTGMFLNWMAADGSLRFSQVQAVSIDGTARRYLMVFES